MGRPYPIRSGLIQDVRFSPDGGTLAVSYIDPNDPAASGLVDLIDPRTRKRRLRIVRLRSPDRGRTVRLRRRRVPADGRDLLVGPVAGAAPSGPAAPLYRVDGETGAVKAPRCGSGRDAFYASDDGRPPTGSS